MISRIRCILTLFHDGSVWFFNLQVKCYDISNLFSSHGPGLITPLSPGQPLVKMWVIMNILKTVPARESQLLKTEDLAHSLKFQNIA